MNLEKKDIKIYILCGDARAGKDTSASIIRNTYEKNGLKAINIQISSTIKEYAKVITGWGGSDEDKPRAFLQQLGTDLIRKKIDNDFFINRIIQDIEVYSYFYDCITISDVRFTLEVDSIKKKFKDALAIKVLRPNFDNGLTQEEKKHSTETGLDGYDKYDYILVNDSTIENLENKIYDMLKELE